MGECCRAVKEKPKGLARRSRLGGELLFVYVPEAHLLLTERLLEGPAPHLAPISPAWDPPELLQACPRTLGLSCRDRDGDRDGRWTLLPGVLPSVPALGGTSCPKAPLPELLDLVLV